MPLLVSRALSASHTLALISLTLETLRRFRVIMAAKFSLEKAAGGKRPAQENTSPQQAVKKIPKVSQMQPAEPRPQRATTNAPGDCFGFFWEAGSVT